MRPGVGPPRSVHGDPFPGQLLQRPLELTFDGAPRGLLLKEVASDTTVDAVRKATGAALLMSAACDRAIGGWDERFFLYSEETDFAARARRCGYSIRYIPTARVSRESAGLLPGCMKVQGEVL